MRRFTITSSFQSLPIEIFWYPSKKKTTTTIVLLKGLYGLHDPLMNSWDTELVSVLNDDYNFVCVNTARRGATTVERSSWEAFVEKKFEQECVDIQQALMYLTKHEQMSLSESVYIIGNSFGGTTLLGLPEIMGKASGIIMIGSGCGKSSTTSKPLLATLYDEEKLLSSLRVYSGIFAFVHGSEDDIVPKSSQDKIIVAASSVRMKIVYTITGAQHDLTSKTEMPIPDRARVLSLVLRHVVSLAEV